MNKHTMGDLYQMQSLPLSAKIHMTEQRIRGWYDHFNGDVYVSFSGGKDSTVLVDIVTQMGYTDIPLVFVDTGLEYPEIREFVKGYGDRVTWLKPKMNFKKVIERYGYPFISKETSETVAAARKYLKNLLEDETYSNGWGEDSVRRLYGMGEYSKLKDSEELANILNERMKNREGGENKRLAILLGMLTKDKENPVKANPGKDRSMYSLEKYQFFLDADFEIASDCCRVMKKNPVHNYSKQSGRVPITAQMASESRLRTQQWIRNGCNGFELKSPISNPMSFWTEQDVLLYIKEKHLPICSVYGEVVEDLEGTDAVEGQMTMSDIPGWEDQGIFDAERPPLKTTGCKRTGCMFCGYGCHMEKGEGRFERMKETHPKQYDYIMRPWEEGGLNYKEVIDWINEHGNLNIKY